MVHMVAVTIVRTGVVPRGHELYTYLLPPTLTTVLSTSFRNMARPVSHCLVSLTVILWINLLCGDGEVRGYVQSM